MTKPKKTMKTDNELIAEFMGMKRHHTEHEEGIDYHWTNTPKISGWWAFDDPPPFDRSWNWLMPVVEKINRMDKMVTINYYTDAHVTITKIYSWGIGDNVHEDEFEEERAIDSVYKAVVNFIKWHNSQTAP
jgi:hypothetical protein